VAALLSDHYAGITIRYIQMNVIIVLYINQLCHMIGMRSHTVEHE